MESNFVHGAQYGILLKLIYIKANKSMATLTKEQELHMLAELKQDNPLRNPDIISFYMRHQDTFMDQHLDYHFGIYHLLLFIDLYGGVLLPIGHTGQTTTLRKHTLRVTDEILVSLKNYGYYIWGVFAALSCNIGFGYGDNYCDEYHKKDENSKKTELIKPTVNTVVLGQASTAILRRIPEIKHLHCFNDIKEIIRLYSIFMPTSITNSKNIFDKDSVHSKLAKSLVAAELDIIRDEIFDYAKKRGPDSPGRHHFLAVGEELQSREAEAAEIAQSSKNQREQLDNELQKAYIGELEGLRNANVLLRAIDEIKDKIIAALEEGNNSALVQQLRQELSVLLKSKKISKKKKKPVKPGPPRS